MNAQEHEKLLLLDALQQVVSNPLGRCHWRILAQRVLACKDQNLHQYVFDELQRTVPINGLAGFHRGVFCAHLFQVPSAVDEAAIALLSVQPTHVDRIVAFLNSEWARSLANGNDQLQFFDQISAALFLRLLQLAAAQIVLPETAALDKSREMQRVVIYTQQLADQHHPPTLLVFQYVEMLQAFGLELLVLSGQELEIPHSDEYMTGGVHINTATFDQDLLGAFTFPGAFNIVCAEREFSIATRYARLVHQVAEFRPDLIFFIGHHSPLISALYRQYPIMVLNVNSREPAGEFDLCLSAQKQVDIDDTRRHYYPYRTYRKSHQNFHHTSPALKQEGQVTLITVGARLEQEITAEWAQKMMEILQQYPNLRWKIVGGRGELPSALQGIENREQIELLPHTSNILACYQASDIYVNPPRIGGGFSVAEAMAEGLPCVAYLGTDGGAKLGELALTKDQYFLTLGSLIESSELRQHWSTVMQKKFANELDLRNAGPKWMEAAELARQRYFQRQTDVSD